MDKVCITGSKMLILKIKRIVLLRQNLHVTESYELVRIKIALESIASHHLIIKHSQVTCLSMQKLYTHQSPHLNFRAGQNMVSTCIYFCCKYKYNLHLVRLFLKLSTALLLSSGQSKIFWLVYILLLSSNEIMYVEKSKSLCRPWHDTYQTDTLYDDISHFQPTF